jgi:hypothetical protein
MRAHWFRVHALAPVAPECGPDCVDPRCPARRARLGNYLIVVWCGGVEVVLGMN